MPGRRRTRATSGQAKAQPPATQTTLKELFQRTNSGETVPIGEKQHLRPEHTDPEARSLKAANPPPPAQPSKPAKPSQLFSIFTKVSSVRERPKTIISVDDTEIIDITDMSSDIELSTEPPFSSIHQLSPHSEFGQATSHSPPLSPTHLCIHCSSDTSIPHVGAQDHTRSHKISKRKVLNGESLGIGDIAPFPTPLKRGVFPGFGPSDQGALDFLTKWQLIDDTCSAPLDGMLVSLTTEQCEEYLQSLSRDYVEAHPAFAQISIHRQGTPLRHAEMWTRRFRPRRANEVLGNERHALYLRDWLRALELHLQGHQPEEPASKYGTARENKGKGTLKRIEPRGMKRPRVIRAVTRKRGNKKRRVDSDDDLDDFVVYSDADDEEQADEPPEDSEDELTFCQRTLARLHRRDTIDTHDTHLVASDDPDAKVVHTASRSQVPVQTNFADKLTNTLLITGPPGCGKTAAVYACAEELGWGVFEVYPGIGKRNGASLDQLVGDVGRNHIVQTIHKRAPTKATKGEAEEHMGLRGYLTKKTTGEFAGFGEPQEAGAEGQPISVEGGELQPLPPDPEKDPSEEAAHSGKCHVASDGSRPIVRQSLVLLEEVDILFKEDAGFWPAVVGFIRRCQRPVVMTCNDPGLVPLADLPLQTVLVFEPCPSTVATTFLQCVSLTEGCLVPREDLMVLYESMPAMDGLDVPDGLGYPRTEPVPLRDLRRSITKLQMLCAGARHGSASEMHPGDEAGGHVRRSARPISAASRVASMGSPVEGEWWRKMNRHSELMSHVDAELCGVRMGRGEVVSDEEEGYVVLAEGDELIAEAAIRHARGLHEGCGAGPSEASINPATRPDASGFRTRVAYPSRMVEALEGILAPPAPLMPQRCVFLDYIPWVRHMVLVDDELERCALAGRAGRCTRNSLRTAHARTIVAGDRQRAALRTSRLGG